MPTAKTPHPSVTVREATEADAPGLVSVLEGIAAERVHSAIDVIWPVEKQRTYLASLSDREAVLVAVAKTNQIVGVQTFDLWAPTLTSMQHVAQIGTFLVPEWRRRGVGRLLFKTTEEFARSAGYAKMIAQVRASNDPAKAFYRRLGFRACGRLARQVRIDGTEDDEILMELFLAGPVFRSLMAPSG
jgi:ribosomal protein S18 acetylase RimI-like enzyme